MKNPGDEFNRNWREANERVRDAEDGLHEAWNDFASGRAGAPPAELLDEVTRRRRVCDAELSALLANIQVRRRGESSQS